MFAAESIRTHMEHFIAYQLETGFCRLGTNLCPPHYRADTVQFSVAMTDADRTKAAVLAAQARAGGHAMSRAELLSMAQAYLRLAEQADRNQRTDDWYETPLAGSGHECSE
jgi:hypothetical protein